MALLMTGPAAAAVVPIIGAYGDEAGCDFYMSGMNPSESMLLLTPDSFHAPGTRCDFLKLAAGGSGRYAVDAVCDGGDAERPGVETLAVTPKAGDGLFVEVMGHAPWGPLALCPGSADPYATGVNI